MKFPIWTALVVSAPFAMSACGPMIDVQQQAITDKVAADAVEQYNIAKSSGGSAIDLCVQAGFVAAAYLQAKNDTEYSRWKMQQDHDCDAGNVPH